MSSPEEWRKLHLIDILDGSIRNGYSPNASDTETGYYVLGLGALGDNGLNIKAVKPVKFTKEVKQSLLQVGDFLISRSNTPDKVGRTIRFKGELSNCSYPDLMMRFRIDCNKADPNFIELKLKSSTVRDYFTNCAAGSSGTMVKINKSVVEKTPLLLPSHPEQQKIAEILSTWDKAIDKFEALIAAKQKRKKALMQKLLTGKQRFPCFDQEWKHTYLKNVCSIFKGEQLNKIELTKTGDYPALNGGVGPSGFTDKFNTEANTITISEGGNSCGFVNYITQQFWCGGHCYTLKNLTVNMAYLYQFLKSIEVDIMKLRVGSGLPNIQKKDIEIVSIKIPSSEEQQKIAIILTIADNEITIHQNQLTALKKQKKALMQQLLTGKKRVI
jgi:type I restriction enzyme, S subunit